MADASIHLDELVDLKMLPAWVSEPPPTERYAQHDGQDRAERRHGDRRPRDKRGPDRRGPRREFGQKPGGEKRPDAARRHDGRPPRDRNRSNRPSGPDLRRGKHRQQHHHRPVERPLPPISVKFLPRAAAFQSVVDQIKSGTVAYSLFALARLFLEKAPRHDVKLTATPEAPLFQLGENGAVSVDKNFLERNAFRFSQGDFYRVDVTETEPIKGNFTNVARERFSGTLLGPTNHHDYQRRLRSLYEQRFSRRMSFPDFQRQIQIVTDPAEIEKWKDEARKVTTYSTLREEPAQTFSSIVETERHFQKNHLPGIVRAISEVVIEGPASRHMRDRVLNKVIESEWNRETKSPSPMMQELASAFREAGLHVFRHRKGMLFVSPVFPRPFRHQETGVSPQVRTILDAIAGQPRIGRKELADKLISDPHKTAEPAVPGAPEQKSEGRPVAEETEKAKLALASDLLWLINAGHVIEFNDGSLDLPRVKKPKDGSETESKQETAVEAVPIAKVSVAAGVVAAPEQGEGGSPVELAKTANDLVESGKETEGVVAAVVSTDEPDKQASATADASKTDEAPEIGGS